MIFIGGKKVVHDETLAFAIARVTFGGPTKVTVQESVVLRLVRRRTFTSASHSASRDVGQPMQTFALNRPVHSTRNSPRAV